MKENIKTISIIILLILLIFCCVNKVWKSDFDQVVNRNTFLTEEIEELKFGIPKLLQNAKELRRLGDFQGAKNTLDLLLRKSNDAIEVPVAKALIKSLEEEIQWKNATEKGDLNLIQQYAVQHPNGKYIHLVNMKIEEINKRDQLESYERAVQKNSSYEWSDFLANYPDYERKEEIEEKIISLKIDEIFSDNSTGELPQFSQNYYGNKSSSLASVTIKNDTGKELIVRFKGPEVKLVQIPIGSSNTTEFLNGNYKIAASAGGLNYAGTANLSGHYESTYYITTTRY